MKFAVGQMASSVSLLRCRCDFLVVIEVKLASYHFISLELAIAHPSSNSVLDSGLFHFRHPDLEFLGITTALNSESFHP